MNSRKIFPHIFIIQWHLTERCNWHCSHCYREGDKYRELTLRELKGVFSQCLELFRALHVPRNRAHIHIGGGEPFLRNDLFKFLEFLKKHGSSIKIHLMTNGSFITESIAKDLKKMKLGLVQVSVEGLKETNDKIRGKGSFETIMRAIEILKKQNIPTRVSLTLTRMNLNEIDDLAVHLKSVGVNGFGIRRYVPIGIGKQLKKEMLSPLELKRYYIKREELRKRLNEPGKFSITYGCEDGFFSAQTNDFHGYVCGVVRGIHLCIFPNGDIIACRRFPVVLGNVLRNTLLDVYFSSDKLWSFRNLNNAHSLCRKCSYFKHCLGGAKCVTHAYFRNPFAPDPQCWRLFKKLPHADKYVDTGKKQIK